MTKQGRVPGAHQWQRAGCAPAASGLCVGHPAAAAVWQGGRAHQRARGAGEAALPGVLLPMLRPDAHRHWSLDFKCPPRRHEHYYGGGTGLVCCDLRSRAQDAIHLSCDGGRVCRPLIICHKGVPQVTAAHMQVCLLQVAVHDTVCRACTRPASVRSVLRRQCLSEGHHC
jgi:hypothetical protein